MSVIGSQTKVRQTLVPVAVVLAACGAGGETSGNPSTSTTTVFHRPGVEDRTGAVLEWECAEGVDSWADTADDFRWGIRQSDSRTMVIEVDAIELTLDGYLGDRPDPEVGCALMGVWREVRVIFAEPVDAEAFALNVIEPPS